MDEPKIDLEMGGGKKISAAGGEEILLAWPPHIPLPNPHPTPACQLFCEMSEYKTAKCKVGYMWFNVESNKA